MQFVFYLQGTCGVLVGYLWGVIWAALSIHPLHVYVSNGCANPTFLLIIDFGRNALNIQMCNIYTT